MIRERSPVNKIVVAATRLSLSCSLLFFPTRPSQENNSTGSFPDGCAFTLLAANPQVTTAGANVEVTTAFATGIKECEDAFRSQQIRTVESDGTQSGIYELGTHKIQGGQAVFQFAVPGLARICAVADPHLEGEVEPHPTWDPAYTVEECIHLLVLPNAQQIIEVLSTLIRIASRSDSAQVKDQITTLSSPFSRLP